MSKAGYLLIMVVLLMVLLSGCIPGHERYTEETPAGFFWGVWHGWLAPISLIWSLFDANVGIYETENVGWWYDFGFYIAIIGGFGTIALFRSKE